MTVERFPTRTMTCGELIKELQKFDSNMPVVDNGWIIGVRKEKCRVEEGGKVSHPAVRIEYDL
jgi:hypothetical protein